MGKRKKKFTPQTPSLSQFPDADILVEAAMRRGQSLNELIKPTSQSAAKISLNEWKQADLSAKNVDYPDRNPMYRVYDNIDIDLDLTSVIETRTLKVKQAKFNIVGKDKKPNEDAKLLLDKSWFRDFIGNAMRWVTRGYRVLEVFKFNEAGELLECPELNEFHVKPEKGIVTRDEYDDVGISYLDKGYQLYYIPVGKPADMGLLRKIAPIVLAKKYAIGHWSSFNEKMGIPFRTVHTKSVDKARQQQLAIIMDQMGSAGWAVLTEDERVELMDIAATNPTQCFETFINMLNAQIAMAMNGQSSTADSSKQKGTYGSLKILNEISEDRHQSDLTFIKDLVNDELFPRLVQISPFYSILKDLKLEWDDSEKLSVKDVVDVIVSLTGAGFKISAETVTQKTGIQVEEGPPPSKTPPTAGAKKKA